MEILDFSKENMLILVIDTADLQLLIKSESFHVIYKLVDASSQLEKPKFTQSLFAMPKSGKQPDKSVVSLNLADVIDYSFEMSNNEMTNDTRLRMMTSLQLKMDFENLAAILIKRQETKLMFDLFQRKDLRTRNKKKSVIASFK